jgi:hypothetical protein
LTAAEHREAAGKQLPCPYCGASVSVPPRPKRTAADRPSADRPLPAVVPGTRVFVPRGGGDPAAGVPGEGDSPRGAELPLKAAPAESAEEILGPMLRRRRAAPEDQPPETPESLAAVAAAEAILDGRPVRREKKTLPPEVEALLDSKYPPVDKENSSAIVGFTLAVLAWMNYFWTTSGGLALLPLALVAAGYCRWGWREPRKAFAVSGFTLAVAALVLAPLAMLAPGSMFSQGGGAADSTALIKLIKETLENAAKQAQ